MSLVNDMLNDLEQRRSREPGKRVDVEWLAGQSVPRRPRSRKPVYIVSVLAALILLAVVAWLYRPAASLERAAGILNPVPVRHAAMKAAKSDLRRVAWLSGNGVTRLRLAFTDNKPYSIKRNGNGLELRFYNTESRLGEDLSPKPPVTSMAVQQDADDVVVILQIAGKFSFSDRRLKDSADTVEVVLQSTAKAPSAPVDKTVRAVAVNTHSTVKQNVAPVQETHHAVKPVAAAPVVSRPAAKSQPWRPTVSQQDMRLEKRARKLIREGDSYRARQLLEDFVTEHPQALRSGKLLISLWLSQQRFGPANDLLASLLRASPDDIELHVLKARLLMGRGDNAAAVDWLMKAAPDVRQHPEYYELLGFAARQNRQYSLSEQAYRGLVEMDAGRGDWLVGLAIALDAQAKTAEALRVYRQALTAEHLSPALKQYAEQRLSATNQDGE